MIFYKGEILTAFDRGGWWNYAVHRSTNGKKLGGGSPENYYVGTSRVIKMIPYKNGVLTAFERNPDFPFAIHWSEDGTNLGGGSPAEYYEGPTQIITMCPYKNEALDKDGVLTAFGWSPGEYVAHWSEDGKHLVGGSPEDYYHRALTPYEIIPYKGGVLSCFDRYELDRANFPGRSLYWSQDGTKLAGGWRYSFPYLLWGNMYPYCLIEYKGKLLCTGVVPS
jgi:hypothetical protein